LAIFSKELGPL